MMDPTTQKRSQLIDRLLEMSRAGSLDWKETPDATIFMVSFASYTMAIQKRPSRTEDPDFILTLINKESQPVESFSDADLTRKLRESNREYEPVFPKMSEIFELAQRRARGADKALDEILEVLSQARQ